MTLKAPNLDDRKFQDIVREARSKIPLYCPKWTDYNLSDPGITLIELFAWMTDMMLYRLNRVPEKNYIKFMEMIGIKLARSKAASVDISFRLSGVRSNLMTIPRGTEVATVRSETEEAITFTTQKDLEILVPHQLYALKTIKGDAFEDCLQNLNHTEKAVTVFEPVPQPENAFYLGYQEDLAGQTLQLEVDSNIEGIGVDPRDPPLCWEYWDATFEKWLPTRIESDTTGGLNTLGEVIILVPYSSTPREIDGKQATWIRCRATPTREGQRPYHTSPRVKSIKTGSIGGTVPAIHALLIGNEVLGRSDGTPGQVFTLKNTPVLKREAGQTIEVETQNEGEFETWQEVSDFSRSKNSDPHFTVDEVSGEVHFGPSIRNPSGEEKQYGSIPPVGRLIRFSGYYFGGGVAGNVGENTIRVLKSSIPYVDSVNNYKGAAGGVDAETLEHAMMRVPDMLKGRTRAVTADDFEYLALEASSEVARAKCIAAGENNDRNIAPGSVVVLLVPVTGDCEKALSGDDFRVPHKLAEEVRNYLDERRLLGTRLEISNPAYQQVAVEVLIKARPGSNRKQIIVDVNKLLYRYLNPITGGPAGTGWPFGRTLSASEVFALVQKIENVDSIEEIALFPIDPKSGKKLESSTKIRVSPDALICSGIHEVTVE